jgi:hypothetical protein
VPQVEIYTGPAERAGGTPREQLKQLFVELEATIRAPEFRGCPFASGSSELADLAHPAHPVIRRHKKGYAAGCSLARVLQEPPTRRSSRASP